MIKITQTLFILLIAIVISSCGESSPYPILESGVKPGNSYRILWLDNERVLFFGTPKQSKNLTKPEWVGKEGLYIWNIREKSIKQYKAGYYVPGCYHEGYILYSAPLRGKALDKYRKDAGTHVRAPHWEGMFGEETYRTHYNDYLGEKPSEQLVRSKVDCRLYQNAPGMMLQGRNEYIEAQGEHSEDIELYFHADQLGIRKKLPIKPKDLFGGGGIRFYPFQNRYLTHGPSSRESCRQGKCMPVWWISREGDTEKILLPVTSLPSNLSLIRPIKIGYFVVSLSVSSGKGGGRCQAKRIIEGFVRNAAVSPDGCKVAFNHYKKTERRDALFAEQIKLKVINFCSTN